MAETCLSCQRTLLISQYQYEKEKSKCSLCISNNHTLSKTYWNPHLVTAHKWHKICRQQSEGTHVPLQWQLVTSERVAPPVCVTSRTSSAGRSHDVTQEYLKENVAMPALTPCRQREHSLRGSQTGNPELRISPQSGKGVTRHRDTRQCSISNVNTELYHTIKTTVSVGTAVTLLNVYFSIQI